MDNSDHKKTKRSKSLQTAIQEQKENRGIEYVKHGEIGKNKRIRRYIAVAKQEGSQLKVGISACSEKDQFHKAKGLMMARVRAAQKPEEILTIPAELLALEKNSKEIQEFFAGELPGILKKFQKDSKVAGNT